jgi:sulfur carrier protein
MIQVTINGESREVAEPLTICGLLAQFEVHERMVVVEHNGEIVARAKYAETPVVGGDNIEIVQMMAGG